MRGFLIGGRHATARPPCPGPWRHLWSVAVSVLMSAASAMAQGTLADGVPTFESVTLQLGQTQDVGGCIGPGVVDLPDVHFGFDQSTLVPQASAMLDILAQVVRHDAFARFVLQGHTDATGTDAYNMQLSRDRAISVQSGLRARGTLSDALSVQWYGERRLLHPDDPGHPHNRRVTLLRINPNSALYDPDPANSGLSFRVMVAGPDGNAFVQNIDLPMQTGDRFFLCVAAQKAGMIEVAQKPRADSDFETLGTWEMPEGTFARAPATGLMVLTGQPGIERLRLRHVARDAACRTSAMAALESITLSGGQPQPRQVPAGLVDTAACACGTPGVVCTDLALHHQ